MDIVKILHHYIMFLGVLYMLFAVIKALLGWFGKRPFTTMDAKTGKLAMMVISVQALIGIALLVHLIYTLIPFSMALVMKDAMLRNVMVEHPLIMLIAVSLVSIGYSRVKKLQDDTGKHRASALYYAIGLLLILVAVPWWKVF